MPARTKAFWRIFAIVFLAHFAALVSVVFYAMSWSILTPSSVPFHIRSGVADVVFAVLAFPLSVVLVAFPSFSVPGYFGWLVFAMVSALWAYVIAHLLARKGAVSLTRAK